MTKTLAAIAALAIAAPLVAGCGGDSSNSSGGSSSGAYGSRGSTGSTQATATTPNGATVAVSSKAGLGPILVDSRGFTLYDFHKDKGGKPSCYGACAAAWPPLVTNGQARAMQGADAAKLGTAPRTDGTTQVTYAGWPLYTFSGDSKPGEANGNDVDAFGAEWYALQPSGQEPED